MDDVTPMSAQELRDLRAAQPGWVTAGLFRKDPVFTKSTMEPAAPAARVTPVRTAVQMALNQVPDDAITCASIPDTITANLASFLVTQTCFPVPDAGQPSGIGVSPGTLNGQFTLSSLGGGGGPWVFTDPGFVNDYAEFIAYTDSVCSVDPTNITDDFLEISVHCAAGVVTVEIDLHSTSGFIVGQQVFTGTSLGSIINPMQIPMSLVPSPFYPSDNFTAGVVTLSW